MPGSVAADAGRKVAGQHDAAVAGIDGADTQQRNRAIRQHRLVVLDLHPVACRQAAAIVRLERPQDDRVAVAAGDGPDHRAVVARPFERRRAAGAAVVDLDAIEMVLLAAISRRGAGPEPAAIDGLQALAQLVRREAGVAPERQDRNLPDEPGARRGVGAAQGDLADRIVLDSGDQPLPDVEIDQRRALLEFAGGDSRACRRAA